MGITEDVNIIAQFIAGEDISDLQLMEPVDCIVLCVSSVLYSCETVFQIIQDRPDITKTLVLCGGIGHSTEPIYAAVAKHPRFNEIAAEVRGLPEAQVLHAIFKRFYASQLPDYLAPQILLEDCSVTCATNAVETRKLLENHGLDGLDSVVIIQDPTMVRRTLECFKKVYEDAPNPPRFKGCPIFVPLVKSDADGQLVFEAPNIAQEQMWPMDRYLELVMGEIPRMRDDRNGYGPQGKSLIPHVNIPAKVEQAYNQLCYAIPNRRYKLI
ncbi:hypothetical protein OPT61_g7553 [Boeremia exigua]|uniref:Uncharacterized protein n=1 Tax=Boeremia exigua TaxID=749465 RepID=A0ACC2I2A3_9PLEO|nr:hypothetical protein OPT61_g7553 [Boeremia exigua]